MTYRQALAASMEQLDSQMLLSQSVPPPVINGMRLSNPWMATASRNSYTPRAESSEIYLNHRGGDPTPFRDHVDRQIVPEVQQNLPVRAIWAFVSVPKGMEDQQVKNKLRFEFIALARKALQEPIEDCSGYETAMEWNDRKVGFDIRLTIYPPGPRSKGRRLIRKMQ